MFRTLIPKLAAQYRVIAPDLPGFGFSDAPARDAFPYTFEGLTNTLAAFTDALGLQRYGLYVFDYGAPIGFRLALQNPERITAIISQSGNAYEAGLSAGWEPIKAYWQAPTDANRRALKGFLTAETTRWQYLHGVADPALVAPESYTLDQALLDRPGNIEIQLDLFADYRTNVALYPAFHAYFRAHQPPFLATWGQNDPFFLPAGAEAFKTDLPDAEIHFLDTGHFALETHAEEIAALIVAFLARAIKSE
jgi:pimeloyl-ACP methyl ester carboxylesterase